MNYLYLNKNLKDIDYLKICLEENCSIVIKNNIIIHKSNSKEINNIKFSECINPSCKHKFKLRNTDSEICPKCFTLYNKTESEFLNNNLYGFLSIFDKLTLSSLDSMSCINIDNAVIYTNDNINYNNVLFFILNNIKEVITTNIIDNDLKQLLENNFIKITILPR